MRFVIGADESRPVVDRIVSLLRDRGHEVRLVAPKAWGEIALEIAHDVADERADYGIVCCWTGTGVCMAANKVHGVRAALCVDAPTAAGARRWNDANVLAISLRLTSEPLAEEIVEAWLGAAYGGSEASSLQAIAREERR